ncbi:MAG TPA: hypothetical protein VL463_28085 [Kofleriaceae bacterium]|nr:hypothetical protein [Kofleriaceae bacterium]
MRIHRSFLSAALFAGACSAAYADKAPSRPPVRHDQALAIAPEAQRAVYNVNVEDESGSELAMFAKGGRYYVLGDAGDRYIIHVTNPTASRVEAVITVDGLDVIDGEPGDLRKRGYVIPPYGDLNIEGFRTSQTDVATFRFSSVGDSYAERKGKGRNVGVIAVAIFEEVAQPQIVEPSPPPVYDYRRDIEDEDGSADKDEAPPPAPPPTTTSSNGASRGQGSGSGGGYRPATGHSAPKAKAPAPTRTADRGGDDNMPSEGEALGGAAPTDPCCTESRQERERPGLGTEFGESRYSSVTFTKFVRASSRPAAVAELRYNDAAGLTALGIPVQPMPDTNELNTRETADPFPGDAHFARPPAGVR